MGKERFHARWRSSGTLQNCPNHLPNEHPQGEGTFVFLCTNKSGCVDKDNYQASEHTTCRSTCFSNVFAAPGDGYKMPDLTLPLDRISVIDSPARAVLFNQLYRRGGGGDYSRRKVIEERGYFSNSTSSFHF